MTAETAQGILAVRAYHPVGLVHVNAASIREHQVQVLESQLDTFAVAADGRVGLGFALVADITAGLLPSLTRIHSRCTHLGGSLVLFGVGPNVRNVLRTTRLDRQLQIVDDEPAANATLSLHAAQHHAMRLASQQDAFDAQRDTLETPALNHAAHPAATDAAHGHDRFNQFRKRVRELFAAA